MSLQTPQLIDPVIVPIFLIFSKGTMEFSRGYKNPAFVTSSTIRARDGKWPCPIHSADQELGNLFDNEVSPNSAGYLFLGGVLCFVVVFVQDGKKIIQWWHEIIWCDETQFAIFAMSVNVLIREIALQNQPSLAATRALSDVVKLSH